MNLEINYLLVSQFGYYFSRKKFNRIQNLKEYELIDLI